MLMLLVEVITVLVLIFLIQMIQELIPWLILVGICVSITKPDVDDGVRLDLP